MAVHVLGHVLELPEHLHVDRERELPGARLRSFLLAAALVVGAVVAIAALPAVHQWVDWGASHHRHDG
jgi:hypothetical protein